MSSGRLLVTVGTLGLTLGCSSEAGQSSAGSIGTTGAGGSSMLDATTSAGMGGSGVTSGSAATTGAVTTGTGTTGATVTTGMGGTGSTTMGGATTGMGGQSTTSGSEGGSTGSTGMGGSGAGGLSGATSTEGSGGAGAGGATGSGGSGGSGGAVALGNPPVPSTGCGTPTTVTTGKKTITSTGQERTYIIDIPANYDENTPHRLFYTSHWIGSTSEAVRDQDYYFLKPLAEADGVPAIFVAPQSDGDTWQEKDHALFDDILAFVKENLCIDTSRVFATGFSFGGMITYSLSVNHQKDIRAAVGIAPANYNIYVPPATHEPIAWMQTTGMSDGTCPWVNGNSTTQGAKYIALEHATDNGCSVPSDIPTWQSGNHICYDFEGCPTEYPVKACTFAGGHTNIDNESGSNWIPEESWAFFMQF